ncbi:hypothetical protein F5I97DRAFT_506388 [Phlebopus sp. FC_14]|nr:hypothetical protein F5I97DRAFT_506388 [Phlebopus sp. FC_14]
MSTSRVQTPPVNLKERIAALQQRNVSPNQHQSSQMASRSIPVNGTGALRDKIAKFEEKGGMPVPRGSFGMGTPQLAENAPAKKRGELYGNRVQGLGRPSGPPLSRSGSPLPPTGESPSPRKRCVSTGGALSGSPPSFRTDDSVPPVPSNLPYSNPRRNSLAAELSTGRRVVSTGSAGFSDVHDTPSPSASHPPPLVEEPAGSPPLPSSTPEPSSSSPESHQPQIVADDTSTVAPPPKEDSEPVHVEPSLDASTPEVASPGAPTLPPPDNCIPLDDGNEPMETSQVSDVAVEEGSTASTDVVQLEVSPSSTELHPTSPAPPSESADVVPLDTPPVSSPPPQIEVSEANTGATQLAPHDPRSAPEPPELHSTPPSPPVCPVTLDTPPVLSSTETEASTANPDVMQPTDPQLSPGPHSPSPASPPGPVDSVPLDTSSVSPPSIQKEPSASTANVGSTTEKMVIPVIVSTSDECDAIPGNAPSSKMRIQAKSPSDRGVQSNQKSSFKAVVHRKVTEPPVAPATASSLATPTTPQITRLRAANGVTVETPASPGYGDLAVLLEEAAMLEKRLTEGEAVNASAETLLPTTPTTATFQPEGQSQSASTLTSHASGDSSSLSGRSVSIPSIREPGIDSDIPEEDEIDGKSLASTTFSQRSPSHRKYLSSIRRFTSRRSSSHMPGAYPRDSISLSSEDSAPVATPPNGNDGKGSSFGIAWPSVSPKKSGSSVGRSSSFTDKIFNRNRTKSNVSTAETGMLNDIRYRSSLYMSSQTNLSLAPTSNLTPDKRSDRADVGARPASWMSPHDGSDFSPTPSLFDKDIFDAFPSVPQTIPLGPQHDGRSIGRASTLPAKGRKHADQRLSMM